MANVLHARSDGGNGAWAELNVSGADLWIGFDIYFVEIPAGSPFSGLAGFGSAGDVAEDFVFVDPGPPFKLWTNFASNGPFATITEGVWYHIDFRHVPGSPLTTGLWVDDVDQSATSGTNQTNAISRAFVGLWDPGDDQEVYIKNIEVGTTRGASNVWTDDLSTGLAAFDDTTVNGAATLEVIGDPTTTPGRVLIALDDGPLEPSPTWTRIDDVARVALIEIEVGRQDERDVTQTGTATVSIHDTDGLFDKGNVDSPYFGNLDGKQILLQMWNPVTETWHSRFRGLIDDYGYDLHPSQIKADVQILCVGFFDYLARLELLPGVHGDVGGPDGNVFYEDGPVDDRIISILTDAGIDPDMYVVFSGNVDVQEKLYDPGDKALVALADAVDSEFPGLANRYEDRKGRIVFHGRRAIFDPEGVIADGPVSSDTWDFTRWQLGDDAAIAGDPDRVKINPPLQWRSGRSQIVNAALATPENIAEADIPGQVVTDATSIANYGVHSISWSELNIAGHKTNGNTANDECRLFAEAWVANLSEPRNRIDALTVKSVRADDPNAEAVWDFHCRVDISDGIDLLVGYPNGLGLGEDFYVQGWTQTIRPGSPIEQGGVDIVETQLNTSPAWSDDVFVDD